MLENYESVLENKRAELLNFSQKEYQKAVEERAENPIYWDAYINTIGDIEDCINEEGQLEEEIYKQRGILESIERELQAEKINSKYIYSIQGRKKYLSNVENYWNSFT